MREMYKLKSESLDGQTATQNIFLPKQIDLAGLAHRNALTIRFLQVSD